MSITETKPPKPSESLEQELMDYVFSSCEDHNKCLEVWMRNPWEAVSLYEMEVYPNYLELPIAMPAHTYTKEVEEELVIGDVDVAMGKKPVIMLTPRAEAGSYEVDGEMIIINKFGRITNPEDMYDD